MIYVYHVYAYLIGAIGHLPLHYIFSSADISWLSFPFQGLRHAFPACFQSKSIQF